tara:strand:- start:485 stop:790 length:306 start_codon:yes stop_codon:yes gene_type:complete
MIRKNKEFLSNAHGEGGSINWYIATGNCIDNDFNMFSNIVEGELKLSDCYRTITLDFSCENIKQLDKRVIKVQTLIDNLLEMKKGLLEAKESINTKNKFYY